MAGFSGTELMTSLFGGDSAKAACLQRGPQWDSGLSSGSLRPLSQCWAARSHEGEQQVPRAVLCWCSRLVGWSGGVHTGLSGWKPITS